MATATRTRRTTKATKPAPAPEPEVVEEDEELEEEEVLEDDEVEELEEDEVPVKGAKSAASAKARTQAAVTFGMSHLADHISAQNGGKKVTTRELRMLARKMARDGAGRINREIVAGNRSRYDWPKGLDEPEVQAIIAAYNGGELEAEKNEKLAALKAQKDAQRAAKKAAEAALEEEDDDEEEEAPAPRRKPAAKAAAKPAAKKAATPARRTAKKAPVVVEDDSDEELDLDDED